MTLALSICLFYLFVSFLFFSCGGGGGVRNKDTDIHNSRILLPPHLRMLSDNIKVGAVGRFLHVNVLQVDTWRAAN